MLRNLSAFSGNGSFQPVASRSQDEKRKFIQESWGEIKKQTCALTGTTFALNNYDEWTTPKGQTWKINALELQFWRIKGLKDLSQDQPNAYWKDGKCELTSEELKNLNEHLDWFMQQSLSRVGPGLKESNVLLDRVNQILGFVIQDHPRAIQRINSSKLKQLFSYLATLQPAEISSLVTDKNGLLRPLLQGGHVEAIKIFASFMTEEDFNASIQINNFPDLNLAKIISWGNFLIEDQKTRFPIVEALFKIAHNKRFKLKNTGNSKNIHHAFSLAFTTHFDTEIAAQLDSKCADLQKILEDLYKGSPEVIEEPCRIGGHLMSLLVYCIQTSCVAGATFLLDRGANRDARYRHGDKTLCAIWKFVVLKGHDMGMLDLFFNEASLGIYLEAAAADLTSNPFMYAHSAETVQFLANRFGNDSTQRLLKQAAGSLDNPLERGYLTDAINQQTSVLVPSGQDAQNSDSFPIIRSLFENSGISLGDLNSYPHIVDSVIYGVIFSKDDEELFGQCPMEIQENYFSEAIKEGCYKIVHSVVNDESRRNVLVKNSYDIIYASVFYRHHRIFRVLIGAFIDRFKEEIQAIAEKGSLSNHEQSGTILHLIAIHSDTSSLDFIQNKLKAQLGDEEVKDLFKKLASIPNQDGKLAEDVALLSEIRCLFKTWRTGENTGPAVEDTQFSLGKFQDCLEEFKATIRQIETLFRSHYDENAPRQQAELYDPDMVRSVMTDVSFKNFIKKGKALKKAWSDLSPDLQNQLSWNTNGLDAHVDQASITVFKHLHEKLPICVSSYRGLRSSPHYLRHDVMMQDSEAIRRIHEYGVSASSKFMTKGMFDIAGIYYNIWNEIWKQSEAQGPMEEKGRYIKDHEHLGMEGVVFYKGEMRGDGSYEILRDDQPTHIRFVVIKGRRQQGITLVTFFPIREEDKLYDTFTRVASS